MKAKLNQRNIAMEVSGEVRYFLVKQGYDSVYGARPLKRLIQRAMQDMLSRELLEGAIKDGDKIVAELKKESIIFSKKETAK